MAEAKKDVPPQEGERIAKRIARAGVCSRRDAEKLIAEGRVSVDGVKLTTPATVVTDDNVVAIDGKPIAAKEPTRLWRYHKPKGLVTSHRDPEGRATLFDHLPEGLPRVISVGRLDLNSEGLLLLTNDGALSRRLELPATGWLRRYRVRVHGDVTAEQLASLAKGVEIDGVRYGAVDARFDRPPEDAAAGVRPKTNKWLTFALREGKNREVRRIAEHLGLVVTRLIRVSYGPFQLGYLEPGQAEEVPARILRDQLGKDDAPDLGEKPARLHAKTERGPRSYQSKTRSVAADKPEGQRSERPRFEGLRADGPRSDGPRSPRSDKPRAGKPGTDKPRFPRSKRADQGPDDRVEPEVRREKPRAPWAVGPRGEPPANSLPKARPVRGDGGKPARSEKPGRPEKSGRPDKPGRPEKSGPSRPGKPKAPRADRRR